MDRPWSSRGVRRLFIDETGHALATRIDSMFTGTHRVAHLYRKSRHDWSVPFACLSFWLARFSCRRCARVVATLEDEETTVDEKAITRVIRAGIAHEIDGD